jgi:hypothetical protein
MWTHATSEIREASLSDRARSHSGSTSAQQVTHLGTSAILSEVFHGFVSFFNGTSDLILNANPYSPLITIFSSSFNYTDQAC